jgi:predicted protein tyrosine phosphatase
MAQKTKEGEMIKEVEIYSQNDLERKCKKETFDDSVLISIGNPHKLFSRRQVDEKVPRLIKVKFKHTLRLRFYDVNALDEVVEGRKKIIPTTKDIDHVIRFINKYSNRANRVVIHCWGGISRSPGIGILVLYLIEKNEDKVIERLCTIAPNALPNKKILELIDEKYQTKFVERRNDVIRNLNNRIRMSLQSTESEELEEIK